MVVEGRSEFVEAMKGASADGNQDIDGDVEDAGGLAKRGSGVLRPILSEF